MLRPYQEIFQLGKPDAEFDNTRRRFSWLKRTLKEYHERYESIFPAHWLMDEYIAQEFCRQTKLHIDGMLSMDHLKVDVSKLIEILQATIEFENDVQFKFDQGNPDDLDDHDSGVVKIGDGGQVDVQTGSAAEIKVRRGMGNKNDGASEQKPKRKNKKKDLGEVEKPSMRPRCQFKGYISEVFEPYLKSYSEQEEKQLIETID